MNDRSPPSVDVEPIVDWLMDGASGCAVPQDVIAELFRRLTEAGFVLNRASVFVTTLHPIVAGRSFQWHADDGRVRVGQLSYEVLASEEFTRSPVAEVERTNAEYRRRLADPDCVIEYQLLEDMRSNGVTDYVALPLNFIGGAVHAAVFDTKRPDGFRDDEIRALRRIRASLARVAEIYALARTAHSLLDAFLGHQVGRRVFSGQVKRGDGEDIHAVIWFCDLRDSTPLAESMSRADYLAMLNEYFDCIAGAVLDGHGEVLRYIGDAVLAIFPVTDANDPASVPAACALAIAAARDALARMDALNTRRRNEGAPPLGFGIGLHRGEVMYGNIGTPTRIEFTVIGSAANETARIESLCKSLGVSLLLSERVAEHLDGDWKSLGKQALKGVGSEIEVFTLP